MTQYGTNSGFAPDKTDEKFASKFGGEDDWGKTKITLKNSKKPEPQEPEKKPQAPKEKEAEPKQLKPTRYIDSNNKFSILQND
jgi:hypothetical protein